MKSNIIIIDNVELSVGFGNITDAIKDCIELVKLIEKDVFVRFNGVEMYFSYDEIMVEEKTEKQYSAEYDTLIKLEGEDKPVRRSIIEALKDSYDIEVVKQPTIRFRTIKRRCFYAQDEFTDKELKYIYDWKIQKEKENLKTIMGTGFLRCEDNNEN